MTAASPERAVPRRDPDTAVLRRDSDSAVLRREANNAVLRLDAGMRLAPQRLRLHQRLFAADTLVEGLTSGRLAAYPIPADIAYLILALLERLSWSADIARFARALPHFPERFGLVELRTALAALGYISTTHSRTGHSLAACPPATLVEDRRGRLWLLDRDTGGQPCLRAANPAGATLPPPTLRNGAQYRTIEFLPAEQHAARDAQMRRIESWSGETLRRFRPEIRLLLGLSGLSGVMTLLTSFAIMLIFDTVLPTEKVPTLVAIAIGLVLIIGVELRLKRIRAELIGRTSGRLEYLLGSALFTKLMRLPPDMLRAAPVGEQMARLRQFETLRDVFGGPFVQVILELPFMAVLLLVVGLIAPQLALVLVVALGVALLAGWGLVPQIRRETRRQAVLQTETTRLVLEAIAHRRRIGRAGLAPVWLSRFDRVVADLARQRRRLATATGLLGVLSSASLPLSAAAVIGTGAVLVMQGVLSGGELVAATILTWRVVAPVQRMLTLMAKLPELANLTTQIDAMMKLPDADRDDPSQSTARAEGRLEAKGIVYRYPTAPMPALVGVSLLVEPGSRVAVTGTAGSGKSTLLKVLAGDYAPQAGQIHLASHNLAQLSRRQRGDAIALVHQEPMLFYGSVAQNLRLVDPMASDERLTALLRELGLGPWLAALPKGLQTRHDWTADRSLMSAGERASFAVAQALLGTPSILLLDAVADAMDRRLESAFMAAIDARADKMSVVMVTQRPSLVDRTDQVVFLDSGQARVTRRRPDGAAA